MSVLVAAAVLATAGVGCGFDRAGPAGSTTTTANLSANVEATGIYAAPGPLPAGPAGQVLAREPVAVPPGVTGSTRATAWRVLYRSQGVNGAPVAVSGLVVRPDGPAPPGGWPVLSWAHGTTGSADRCAPSRAGVVSIPHLDRMLSEGYVVAATDYEGLGTAGPHPYLVGASEGRSVLDAARAARALVPEASGPVLAWGHSQGGQAAVWAGELASSYAPDLGLVGVAAFAPAARQDTFLDVRDGAAPGPLTAGFAVAAAAGLAAARPELRLSDLLTEGALARIGVLETGCIAEVVTTFAMVRGGVLRPDPDRLGDWQEAVADNQAGEQASAVPVLVLQGDDDILVPPAAVERYRQRACGSGSDVEVRPYARADHGSIVTLALADAAGWSAERRAGRPAGGC